jgi:hypothetical protein
MDKLPGPALGVGCSTKVDERGDGDELAFLIESAGGETLGVLLCQREREAWIRGQRAMGSLQQENLRCGGAWRSGARGSAVRARGDRNLAVSRCVSAWRTRRGWRHVRRRA